jgi:hypothetical protein
MTVPAVVAASFCGTAFVFHLVSIIIAVRRCRPRPVAPSEPPLAREEAAVPAVSIVRPVCGLDALLRDLLLPVLWFDAWIGTDFVWRGHQMSIAADATAP